MYNILLVEDNPDISQINKELLEEVGGHGVSLAKDLTQARRSVVATPPDLIVLDIMLPDGSGLDFLRELRSCGNDTPVLILTALSEASDEVRVIREGGDDYISKPYNIEVLLTRINSLLSKARRADERVKAAMEKLRYAAADTVEYGPLTLNRTTKRTTIHGADAGLKPKEFALLEYFLKNTDRGFTAQQLYEAVWGRDALNSVDTVRVHIKELRKKLSMDEDSPVVIETVQRKHYVCRLGRV